ncbi:patatin-like phospholipase family protein [Duganella sp. FT80W]|uniref:Patatin-like phospholipase family protein n=1 Tax=Duganella guangzhouensis TaxID=2666084 RepID=A0A6I2L7X0_9BURK|nr:patatin-like phospholipase family protein [Duganella guangzhouensis]MRW94238.1 patatin-like phospholipase family protein [Duganella guangzhouensis]
MRIVLVLQGGGALGAYQAGVFQALHEHGLAPDWIVGTSIGAINAAILAGNSPEQRLPRLRQFWHGIAHRDSFDMQRVPDAQRRSNIVLQTWDTLLRGVPGFFSPRLFNPFATGAAVDPEQASFYDTGELRDTLNQLIDFDYLNAPGGTRLTVNALKVTSGTLRCFDNRDLPLHADHICASGALPPGFPAVRIDGELYWDGGLYSNTPLETVLDDSGSVDTLCFMVDLWSADGPEPTTLDEVQTRQKDVTFASRSQRHLADYVATHRMQQKLRELYRALPPEKRTPQQSRELEALGCDSTLHVVRLPYAGRDWNMAAKDINFSAGSIDWRWDQGYQDALRAIKGAGWLSYVSEDTPLVVHELPPLKPPGSARAA